MLEIIFGKVLLYTKNEVLLMTGSLARVIETGPSS